MKFKYSLMSLIFFIGISIHIAGAAFLFRNYISATLSAQIFRDLSSIPSGLSGEYMETQFSSSKDAKEMALVELRKKQDAYDSLLKISNVTVQPLMTRALIGLMFWIASSIVFFTVFFLHFRRGVNEK